MRTRRPLSVLLVAAALLAGACGDDDAPEPTAAVGAPAQVDGAAQDATESAAEDPDEEEGVAPSRSGPSGRLEVGDESWNLWLGDMATAMCSVSDGSALVQDMRAADGSWVAASVTGDVAEVALRGPDGEQQWVTGTGVGDATISAMADLLTVDGTWVRADDPSTTAEGTLVVTC